MVYFVLQSLLLAVMLAAPGFLVLHRLGFGILFSICLASPISIVLYCFEGVLFSLLGVPCSGILLFGASLVVAALLDLTRLLPKGRIACPAALSSGKAEFAILGAYVVFSLAILAYFFVRNLSDYDSVVQGFDTVYHLGLARSFLDSGNYSFLFPTLYPAESVDFEPPMEGGSFYPAAWHVLAAMLASVSGVSVGFAANATNYVVGSVVFAGGMFAFLKLLLGKDRLALLAGSFLSFAFVAFPWALIVRGEQFPQLLAFALLPSVISFYLICLERSAKACNRLVSAICFVLGMAALALSQTNALFSAGVFCAAFTLALLFRRAKEPGRNRRKRFVAVGAFGVFVVIVWVVAFNLPFMQAIVWFSWEPYSSFSEALMRWLTLALGEDARQQILLATLVLMGVLLVLARKRDIWLAVLWLIMGAFYIVDVATSGFAKHFLTGFWYTDYDRIAAMLAIFTIPLACYGFSFFVRLLAGGIAKIRVSQADSSYVVGATGVFLACLCLVGIFSPSYTIAREPSATAFGDVYDRMATVNSIEFPGVFNASERHFVERAQEKMDPGAVVISNPDDGSCFAYGMYDMNLYYRRHFIRGVADAKDGLPESEDSRLIRLHLADYASDPAVREAVSDVGARYVLLLDDPKATKDNSVFHTYRWEDWVGLETINEETPGFKLLLSDGDMHLYEINDET